jgi:hypothetical protein
MTSRSLVRRIASVVGRFRSATRVAAAAEAHRSPRPSDLERLGISVAAFAAINNH